MKTVSFSVTGMTCDHCALTAKKALEKVPGVARASVSFDKGGGTAEVADDISLARLRVAVEEAGYGLVSREEGEGSVQAGSSGTLHVVVIGSGSAAFAASLRLVERGARVTMVEEKILGGTCVNVGCVPSKILVRQAHLFHQATHFPFPGLSGSTPAVDKNLLLAQQEGRIAELRQAKYQRPLATHPAITYLEGRATFISPRTIEVRRLDNTVTSLSPERVLIATGSRPSIPKIPGLDGTPFWTSTEALESGEIPESLLVLGGGFVALEIGQAFARLGSKVTIIHKHDRLLNRTEPEIGHSLGQYLGEEGLGIRLSARIDRIRHDERQGMDGKIKSRFIMEGSDKNGPLKLEGDALLVATGRTPNTDRLSIERAGIETDTSGHIRVDDRLETTAPGIFAAGDCTVLPKFVYVAAASGTRAAVFMTGGAESDIGVRPEGLRFFEPLPEVTFTDPQVGTVGMTEEEASKAGLSPVSRTLSLDQVPRALANFDTRGFVKIVAEEGSLRILGVQILAPEAGEVIQVATLAIRSKMTVPELGTMLFPYLTMGESLKLCAQSFTRNVADLSCCAG